MKLSIALSNSVLALVSQLLPSIYGCIGRIIQTYKSEIEYQVIHCLKCADEVAGFGDCVVAAR